MDKEQQIIKELMEDFAQQIGLELQGNDSDTIYRIYQQQKKATDDIQIILLDALYSLQEERVEKSSLVVI